MGLIELISSVEATGHPSGCRCRSRLRWLIVTSALVLCSCGTKTPEDRAATGVPTAVPKGVVAVKIEKTARGFRLLRGGQPYFLRGGGGLQQYGQLRAAGGNTVRLWSTNYAAPLLAEAQRQQLTVMLGLWVQPEDESFSYYDHAAVQAQLDRLRAQVLRYRHHPALLMWNVGNEIEDSTTGPRLFEAINEIARMIHELDPYHPVTISLGDVAGQASNLQRQAPEVDILSVNIYGALYNLPATLKKSGWIGPYIVTEYGSRGYWEVYKDYTPWKAAREQTSTVKAQFMSVRYRRVIQTDTNRCLGSYIFFWGTKFEYTPTWFSLFAPTGEKTETVDELYQLWRGHYPANRAPQLLELRVAGHVDTDNVQLRAGEEYTAVVRAADPERDSLATQWEILPDIPVTTRGKELETPPEPVLGSILRTGRWQATVRAPANPGAYRLYVRVFDGHGSMATANIPLLVTTAPVGARYSGATTND